MSRRLIFRIETKEGLGPFTDLHQEKPSIHLNIKKEWRFGCLKLDHIAHWFLTMDAGIIPDPTNYCLSIYRVPRNKIRISPRSPHGECYIRGYECLFKHDLTHRIFCKPVKETSLESQIYGYSL
jgi:hypothetical protein